MPLDTDVWMGECMEMGEMGGMGGKIPISHPLQSPSPLPVPLPLGEVPNERHLHGKEIPK